MVFRLITFFASAVGLAAFVWFGLTVDLGQRTLFGHIRAISSTPEAEQLVDGAKAKVTEVVGIEAARRAERERARGNGTADRDPPGTAPAGPPQEELNAEDRQGLRRMLEGKGAGKGAIKVDSQPVRQAIPGHNDKQRPAKAAAPSPRPPVKGRVPPPTSRPPSQP